MDRNSSIHTVKAYEPRICSNLLTIKKNNKILFLTLLVDCQQVWANFEESAFSVWIEEFLPICFHNLKLSIGSWVVDFGKCVPDVIKPKSAPIWLYRNVLFVQCDAIRWEQFCGDVVLDSFNMVDSDKYSIKDQKYEKRIFWNLYHEDFNFVEWL